MIHSRTFILYESVEIKGEKKYYVTGYISTGDLDLVNDIVTKTCMEDMVTQLQLEIDSSLRNFLREHAEQDGTSVESLIIRLIERYRRDEDESRVITRQV